jgi:hypothetical protein
MIGYVLPEVGAADFLGGLRPLLRGFPTILFLQGPSAPGLTAGLPAFPFVDAHAYGGLLVVTDVAGARRRLAMPRAKGRSLFFVATQQFTPLYRDGVAAYGSVDLPLVSGASHLELLTNQFNATILGTSEEPCPRKLSDLWKTHQSSMG